MKSKNFLFITPVSELRSDSLISQVGRKQKRPVTRFSIADLGAVSEEEATSGVGLGLVVSEGRIHRRFRRGAECLGRRVGLRLLDSDHQWA